MINFKKSINIDVLHEPSVHKSLSAFALALFLKSTVKLEPHTFDDWLGNCVVNTLLCCICFKNLIINVDLSLELRNYTQSSFHSKIQIHVQTHLWINAVVKIYLSFCVWLKSLKKTEN